MLHNGFMLGLNIVMLIILICVIGSLHFETVAINDEIYNLETKVFGEGNKPKANLEDFPGRIKAIQLKVAP